ncbi:unnamed protein product [Polarella glacialis]|uniref:Uncharacterized protein n=1 Tax=Polarella glacialis TaxID=89957 RepID=A0A813GWJ5_POLGL|nr:unnamed protein product [Polarella glacialis]
MLPQLGGWTPSPGSSAAKTYGSVPGLRTSADALTSAPSSQKHISLESTEAEDAKQRARPSWKDLPALLIPWLMYCMVMLPAALMQNGVLSVIAVATGLLMAGGFVLLSRGLPWRVVAVSCLMLTGIGYFMGRYDQAKYLYPYSVYQRSPSFLDVLPSSAPGAYQDAGYVAFSKGSRVDTTRSIGFVSGSTYCVAPIVSSVQVRDAGFWAVGVDCCGREGRFRCGDALNRTVRSGIVVNDASPILASELPQYMNAAKMAAQTYGINMPLNPMFIRWNTSVEDNAAWYWDGAVSFALIASLSFLLVAPMVLGVMRAAGVSLFGEKAGAHWHPEKLELMAFGFDLVPRVYPKYLQPDLLYPRSFWTGEIIQDYVFHIANKHVFLSCIFCHPVHPYYKWERVAVAVSISTAVLFTTTALTAWLPEEAALRTAFVIGAVTVLRNCMQLLLVNWVIEESAKELEECYVVGGKNVRQVTAREGGIVAAYLVAAAVVALGCIPVIQAHWSSSLTSALSANLDTIGFIFILDVLLDLTTPYIGHDIFEGDWTLGFFGRWQRERDDFEAAKKELEDRIGNRLWSSVGAELLGLGAGALKAEVPRAKQMKTFQDERGQRGQTAKVGDRFLAPQGRFTPTTEKAPLFSQFAVPAGFLGTDPSQPFQAEAQQTWYTGII